MTPFKILTEILVPIGMMKIHKIVELMIATNSKLLSFAVLAKA